MDMFVHISTTLFGQDYADSMSSLSKNLYRKVGIYNFVPGVISVDPMDMVENTQEMRENAFWLDKTGQNVEIFEGVLFFKLRTT